LATANPICVRFQAVAEEYAAFLASVTAETDQVADTAMMPVTRTAGINLRNRRRQHEGFMDLIPIAGLSIAAARRVSRTFIEGPFLLRA
jgi:hypothetical protein